MSTETHQCPTCSAFANDCADPFHAQKAVPMPGLAPFPCSDDLEDQRPLPSSGAADEAERLAAWVAVIREAAGGSDVPKVVGILTEKALRGDAASEHARGVLRAYRVRAQYRIGRVDKSGPGSSPAASVGASDAACTAAVGASEIPCRHCGAPKGVPCKPPGVAVHPSHMPTIVDLLEDTVTAVREAIESWRNGASPEDALVTIAHAIGEPR